jgi:hypothetical protein
VQLGEDTPAPFGKGLLFLSGDGKVTCLGSLAWLLTEFCDGCRRILLVRRIESRMSFTTSEGYLMRLTHLSASLQA